jgi:hypothetical protein
VIWQKIAEELAGKARRGVRLSQFCGQEFVITFGATDFMTTIGETTN